jgi:hypothetical protein
MAKKSLLGKVVAVKWVDIVTHSGLQENIDKCGLDAAITYGVLVGYGPKLVKVASTVYEDGNQPADVTVIPRANVLEVREG